MTSTLSEPPAIFQKSAGEPRLTPAIASPAPRSSTHRPQLIYSSLPPLRAVSCITAATHSRGSG